VQLASAHHSLPAAADWRMDPGKIQESPSASFPHGDAKSLLGHLFVRTQPDGADVIGLMCHRGTSSRSSLSGGTFHLAAPLCRMPDEQAGPSQSHCSDGDPALKIPSKSSALVQVLGTKPTAQRRLDHAAQAQWGAGSPRVCRWWSQQKTVNRVFQTPKCWRVQFCHKVFLISGLPPS
jgi:hypothetical protein